MQTPASYASRGRFGACQRPGTTGRCDDHQGWAMTATAPHKPAPIHREHPPTHSKCVCHDLATIGRWIRPAKTTAIHRPQTSGEPFCGDQREPLPQIKTHLVAKYACCSRTSAVILGRAVLESQSQEVFVRGVEGHRQSVSLFPSPQGGISRCGCFVEPNDTLAYDIRSWHCRIRLGPRQAHLSPVLP